MKRSILVPHIGQTVLIGALCLFPLTTLAANVSVTLGWEAPEVLEGEPALTGFHVHYGTQPRESAPYDAVATAGLAEQVTVSNLVRGEVYYFAVTASNETGAVSGYSEEIAWSHGDLDTDGMQDEWEQVVLGLDPAVAAPNDDEDQDGMSNAAEFTAGTDPNDPQSRSEARIFAANGALTIRFDVPRIEGPWYDGFDRFVLLERSCSLGDDWELVDIQLSLTGSDQQIDHLPAALPDAGACAFYRVHSHLIPSN